MSDPLRTLLARGRYAVFSQRVECGDESWTIEREATGALLATGVQRTVAPHPFPSTLEWRAATDADGRVVTLDVTWRVGPRTVRAEHRAVGQRWRVAIDVDGHVRAQQGEYPPRCEILLGTHGVHALMLRRYVLEPGAVHAFPALLVGPPWMAVEPGRQELRCTGAEEREGPLGPVRARRVEVHDAAQPDGDAWACWVDPHGLVIESCEGLDPAWPWMRLTQLEQTRG